jgi:WD40 repeat protein
LIDWERSGSFAVTPDGRRAISGSYDTTLWLWDLESGKTIRTPKAIRESLSVLWRYARRSPSRLGSSDDTLRLGDLESGNEIANFTGDSEFDTFGFTPNCRMLVAKERPGRVHILQIVKADETKPARGDTKIQLLVCQRQSSDKPKEPSMPQPARDFGLLYGQSAPGLKT